MNEDIRYWRGKRIDQLSLEELRQALAEVYRELERLDWLAHQQKQIIAKTKKKPGRKPATPRKEGQAVVWNV